MSDDELFDTQLCDFDLSIEKSPIQKHIQTFHKELDAHGFKLKPYFWVSDEWFTPIGMTGIAIPFYLVHPRLTEIEKKEMLEAEGHGKEEFLKILRHEMGHVLENAYHLRRRKKRQKIFGYATAPYPDYYQPRPFSRRFVQHLSTWYAQAHPDEDFAETFAVWLTPNSHWRDRYKKWPALTKLEYMDELMREIAPLKPLHTSRAKEEPLHRLRRTLWDHYEERKDRVGEEYPDFYDRDLRRLFDTPEDAPKAPKAAPFLRKIRKNCRKKVAYWTGEYQYLISIVVQEMIDRCQQLDMRLRHSEKQTEIEFSMLLTVQTLNHLHSGFHRVAL